MYIDYYLKFESEAEAKAVLYRVEGEEGNEVANYQFVDVIGTIYKPTGKMLKSEEGEFPEMAPLDGYHVNVRLLNDAPELEPYRVFPENAVRGWA